MSDSQLESVPPWEDAPETAPEYPEFDDEPSTASSFDDEAAEQAVFDGGASDAANVDANAESDADDAPVPPEKEPLIDEIASEFVGFWNRLVSQTNWEKGKVIHSWRVKLIEAGLPRRIYSDESIAQRIGNVSPQHVGRLRRVYERFGASEPLPNLFWSHYQAALDWEDADDWLRKASDEKLSVAQTRIARWEKYGAPPARKPKESEIVVEEPDADVNPFNDSDADFGAYDPTDPDADYPRSNGGRREYESGDDAISPTEGELGDKEKKAKKSKKDAEVDLGEFEGDDEPWESEPTRQSTADVLDGMSKLDPIPTDFAEAFEALKVAIMTRKLASWDDVQPVQIAAYLSATKRLLVSEDR
ncbi:MAG: hypothetical protein IJO06_08585 [Thermoguttaceae bacterium]|nr:hypothetical protein [Thermoguttaceae bacterium]